MKQKSSSSRPKSPDKDIMEKFNASPWYSVGKILPTSAKPKVDVFETYRPNRQCVDYKISETWTKMQKGDVKVNVKQTVATYEEIPPEICKPQRKKTLRLFHGGPPQWKFVDELWMEQVVQNQAKLKTEHKAIIKQVQTKRTSKRKDDHALVQSLVGPDWFMELSPRQLAAIDQLRYAVYWDIRKKTTLWCGDILNNLGLVLRHKEQYIKTALQHSCGSPVEFLLVLYQLIDPKRESYSLNDRLILSSVVHLTIVSTLRELHVRIPSPPRESEELPKAARKKEKKPKYESPYLEPQTYEPSPPRFSGIYKNKHKQHPESPYFDYIPGFQNEKKHNMFCLNYSVLRKNEEMMQKMQEYMNAQEFYESLPGIKQAMLKLIPPMTYRLCPNMRNPRKPPPKNPKLIAPHLCKVTSSEPMICYCEEEGCGKERTSNKKIKRSCCEKNAQKFLGSLCTCDDCLEKVRRDNLVRIHGGFQRTACTCDEPVPIIQGTLQSKVCDCYKEYRDRIVGCAARQRMLDTQLKYIVGEVVITKFGPIYNILGTPGKKICLCSDIVQRKTQLKKSKETLVNNEAKFVISGVTMTSYGPIYNLAAVVARRPCKCILRYRQQLAVLDIQNKVRKHPLPFVNNGLVDGKFGPIFYFSSVPGNKLAKRTSEVRTVCSCEIKKTKCFEHCMNYLEYKVSTHEPKSTSSVSKCTSSERSSSEETESDSEVESCSDEESDRAQGTCPYCSAQRKNGSKQQAETKKPQLQRSCQPSKKPARKQLTSSETTSTESTTEESASSGSNVESTEKSSTSSPKNGEESPDTNKSSDDDYFKPKPCRCKDELERFMKSKCPCEECNRQIRQGYATYVMGGTKMTPSGNQLNIVQGVHQPLCSCMKNHLENIRKIDEYKSRVQARYHLKKQSKKYCISGVKNTPQGPVYIISGMRPPVECECGKAMREKEEKEAFEKQRAKPLNTGRIKYEIAGVKAMPNENIYILSRALNISPCECEKLLRKFQDAHKECMDEFQNFLEQVKEETEAFDEIPTDTNSRTVDESSAQDFENETANSNVPQDEQEDKVPEEEQDIEPRGDEEEALVEEPKENTKCACGNDDDEDESESESETETSSEEEESSTSSEESSSSSDEEDGSECGSCHVDNPLGVRPVTLPSHKTLPESFMSKRFAIFRHLPKCKKTLLGILKHILEGMAEDDFPLAKLPDVHKLPIFKLWIEMRMGVYWNYEDKLTYHGTSKDLWKHTDICFKTPLPTRMPYTIKKARTMTWKNAKLIRKQAAQKSNEFYRELKQVTVDAGREFFATTFPYEFPTYTWRDCAFAYIPTKEADLFPYKIVQPHETRVIPDNKKFHCYC